MTFVEPHNHERRHKLQCTQNEGDVDVSDNWGNYKVTSKSCEQNGDELPGEKSRGLRKCETSEAFSQLGEFGTGLSGFPNSMLLIRH